MILDSTIWIFKSKKSTFVHIHHTVGVAGSNKAILQHQALVVVGTVVYEGLLVPWDPRNTPDFITFRHFIETCLNLKEKKTTIKGIF